MSVGEHDRHTPARLAARLNRGFGAGRGHRVKRERWLEAKVLTPIIWREVRRLIRAGRYRTALRTIRAFVRGLRSGPEETT